MSSDKPTLDDLRIDRAAPVRRKSPVGLIVGLVVLGVVGGVLFWWFNRPKPVAVRTVLVQESGGSGSDRTLLNASGYVEARRHATVSSKVTGKVMEILVEEGMKVEAGQVLARLDA